MSGNCANAVTNQGWLILEISCNTVSDNEKWHTQNFFFSFGWGRGVVLSEETKDDRDEFLTKQLMLESERCYLLNF